MPTQVIGKVTAFLELTLSTGSGPAERREQANLITGEYVMREALSKQRKYLLILLKLQVYFRNQVFCRTNLFKKGRWISYCMSLFCKDNFPRTKIEMKSCLMEPRGSGHWERESDEEKKMEWRYDGRDEGG